MRKCLTSPLLNSHFEILWHAGEPLTVGIDFYETAVKVVRKFKPAKKNLTMVVQTNGTLVNDAWCKFFVRNNINVGISLDGPEFIHDYNRKNWAGGGSFKEVMRAIELFKKYNIGLRAICVVTKHSLDYPDEIFNFFVENGIKWVGLNVDEVDGFNALSSLKDENRISSETIGKFSSFISIFYNNWRKNHEKICIREFDNLINMIQAKITDPSFRVLPNALKDLEVITISKNGNITTNSPEFAGGMSDEYDNFIVGNINSINDIKEIKGHPVYVKMNRDIKVGVDNCASSCKYFDFCGGGYITNKFYENGSLQSTETTTCIFHKQKISSIVIQKLVEESSK